MPNLRNLMMAVSGRAAGYTIDGSGLFQGSADYLSYTPSSGATSTDFTVDLVLKLGQVAGDEWLYLVETSSTSFMYIYYNTDETIHIKHRTSGVDDWEYQATAELRDPSAYYDLCVYVGTAAGDVNADLNGVTLSLTETNSKSSAFANSVGTAAPHQIGERTASSLAFSGYMARVAVSVGNKYDSSNFGEVTDEGFWQLKDCSGLDYSTDGSTLIEGQNMATGTATAGSSYTKTGTITAVSDSPTNDADNDVGNYATLNPLIKGSHTYSNGNLTIDLAGNSESGEFGTAGATLALPSSGKWYWEVTATEIITIGNPMIGVYDLKDILPGGFGSDLCRVYQRHGNKHDGTTGTAHGSAVTATDIVQVAVDMDNGAIYFGINNTWQNSSDPESGASKTGAAFTDMITAEPDGGWVPAIHNDANNDILSTWDFGQNGFTYTPPTGYKALATQNFPAPDVANYEDEYYQTTFTMGASNTKVTVPGFDPSAGCMVRYKRTDSTGDWLYSDTVNGAGYYFKIDSTTSAHGRTTDANSVVSFDSDGITFGTTLTNTGTYLVEVFKIGSYFDVQRDTMPGSGNASFSHDMGNAPGYILGFEEGGSNTPFEYHVSLGADKYLQPDRNVSQQTGVSDAWGTSEPSTTTFGPKVGLYSASVNVTHYLWANDGPYKFGDYDGNNVSDGPLQFSGGLPQTATIKRYNTTGSYGMFTRSANPHNEADTYLVPDTGAAETTLSTLVIDFLSVGTKCRGNQGTINSADNFLFYHFGIQPIQGNGSDAAQGRAV